MNKKKVAYNALISLFIIQAVIVYVLAYLTINRKINIAFFLAVMLIAIIPMTFLIIEMVYTILNQKRIKKRKNSKKV